MSAAKMVADSTQSDTDSRKNRHKSSGRREKKSKKEKRRRRYSSSSSRSRSRSRSRSSSPDSRHGTRSASPGNQSGSEEYDSDIDLDKDLKPLGAYLKNPAGLLDQMLHSVRGSSLQRALPDILKSMPLEELRKRCLEHLEVLSRKRMKRILAGDDPAAISSSGTDDESTDDEKEKEAGADNTADSTGQGSKDGEPVVIKTEEPSGDSPLNLTTDDLNSHHHHQPPPPYQQMEEAMEEEEGEVAYEEDEDEEEEEEWDEEEEEAGEPGGEGMADVLFPEMEQDRMDLLELEMRARAIKAMLALHEQRERSHKTPLKPPHPTGAAKKK